jgi:SAM-dependent methyltransferase
VWLGPGRGTRAQARWRSTCENRSVETEGLRGDQDRLAEQIAYYRARAPQYDEWWFRTGGHTLPPQRKIEWDEEVARLESAVDDLRPQGTVLELACGTGLWTARLLRHAEHLVTVDSSPEMIELNRARTGGFHVEYIEADIFSWQPSQRYDVVFFSFWLSHVPPARFVAFWDLVERSLVSGGRAIFIDNLWGDETAPGGARPTTFEQSRSDTSDGHKYQVVKIFYEPDELAHELADLGWNADIKTTGRSFLLGCATPAEVDRTGV